MPLFMIIKNGSHTVRVGIQLDLRWVLTGVRQKSRSQFPRGSLTTGILMGFHTEKRLSTVSFASTVVAPKVV